MVLYLISWLDVLDLIIILFKLRKRFSLIRIKNLLSRTILISNITTYLNKLNQYKRSFKKSRKRFTENIYTLRTKQSILYLLLIKL